MEKPRNRGRRTRIWLALSLLVCLLGCVALMLLQQQEREARSQSTVARIYAANVEQAIRILRPLGTELVKSDPARLRRTVASTTELMRSEGADFRRIAPEQAAVVDRALGELDAFSNLGTPSSAQLVTAMSAATRIATTAENVAASERVRADRATQVRTFGQWAVLALTALVVALLVHRDRRLVLAVERARAAELAASAETDQLTGLPTRLRFSLDIAEREASGEPAEVVICDLDEFKELNHRLGHEAGDAVLITVASDLALAVGADATLYRTGGDQFALLAAPGAGVPARVRETLERDRAKSLGSVGSARWPEEHASLSHAVRIADMRMYAVKRTVGRGGSPLTNVEADAA